ncbi:MAG: hypothetical protein KAI47_16310 [Deltaproteobacteria bacterium]|nr:hypothetical protein [Deltaproteobacteria bacterium]
MFASRQQLLLSCLAPLLLAHCSRFGFDATHEGGPAAIDARADTATDTPFPDLTPHDSAPPDLMPHDTGPHDLGPSQSLPCTVPTRVNPQGAPDELEEVALRNDGLTLVVKENLASTIWYQTQRSARGQPFGAWTLATFPATTDQDPTFFLSSSSDKNAIVTRRPASPGPRRLYLCTSKTSWSCQAIVVRLATTGLPLTLDMDGPETVTLPNGTLLMAHNVGPQGGTSADIYLAHPTTPNNLTDWTTAPVPALAHPTIKEDDPALSPDGLVIVFYAPGPNTDQDLWVSRRPALSAPFPPPVLLQDVNSTNAEVEPSFAAIPGKPGHYELFFMSDRAGNTRTEVYRTTCGP